MTIEQQPVHVPTLGEQGDPCAHCAAPLAVDQRYCLNCGMRRADGRVDFMEALRGRLRRELPLAGGGANGPPTGATGNLYPWWRSPIAPIGAAVAVFVLILGVGILIGNSTNDSGKQTAAAPPQVITVQGTAAPAAAEQPFTADWPDGQEGFTIQLQTLSKEGTQVTAVDAAKTDATTKGATDVGALDSDQYASLDPGSYVIYSGIFDTRKQAQKALKDLKAYFPDAKVVEVSASGGSSTAGSDLTSGKKEGTASKQQLQQLQKLSPDQYQKQAAKLPDKTKTEGKAPPTDNKKPGGGDNGDAEVIK